jgi:hypothetical protein
MLSDLLQNNGGKMAAKMVKAEVSDAGYSWTAANRAKDKLGIESAKEKGTTKGGWTWYLPKQKIQRNREETEDTTEKSVDYSVSSDRSTVEELL